MPDPKSPRIAACRCGALCLTVVGDPVNVHACTCLRCQRESGSVMTCSAWFPAAVVTISGAYSIWRIAGIDRPDGMMAFCPTCGGGGWFVVDDYLPGHLGISVGSFANPDFDRPHTIYWWDNHPEWLGVPPGPRLHPTQ